MKGNILLMFQSPDTLNDLHQVGLQFLQELVPKKQCLKQVAKK